MAKAKSSAKKKGSKAVKASTKRPTAARPVKPQLQRPPLAAMKIPADWLPFIDTKCNLPHICKFLRALSNWLNNQFIPDYTALRIAVCNVEKQAFAGTGNPNKPPRFCTGGAANEPADPPAPPVF